MKKHARLPGDKNGWSLEDLSLLEEMMEGTDAAQRAVRAAELRNAVIASQAAVGGSIRWGKVRVCAAREGVDFCAAARKHTHTLCQ